MHKGADAEVSLARAMTDLRLTMIDRLSNCMLGFGWRPSTNEWPHVESDEDAAFIGTVEGAWRAFQDAVIRAAGACGTPQSILDMDERCKNIAKAAYNNAYEIAWLEFQHGSTNKPE